MKIVSGYQDTRNNKEDFALTPYLFLVWLNGVIIKVYGIGMCWGYYAIYIGIGFNIPKEYSGFRKLNNKPSIKITKTTGVPTMENPPPPPKNRKMNNNKPKLQ